MKVHPVSKKKNFKLPVRETGSGSAVVLSGLGRSVLLLGGSVSRFEWTGPFLAQAWRRPSKRIGIEVAFIRRAVTALDSYAASAGCQT